MHIAWHGDAESHNIKCAVNTTGRWTYRKAEQEVILAGLDGYTVPEWFEAVLFADGVQACLVDDHILHDGWQAAHSVGSTTGHSPSLKAGHNMPPWSAARYPTGSAKAKVATI
jgi:hypothetical protein